MNETVTTISDERLAALRLEFFSQTSKRGIDIFNALTELEDRRREASRSHEPAELSVADAMAQLAAAIEAEKRRNAVRDEMLATVIVNLEKAEPTAELALAMRDYVRAERPKLTSPQPVTPSHKIPKASK